MPISLLSQRPQCLGGERGRRESALEEIARVAADDWLLNYSPSALAEKQRQRQAQAQKKKQEQLQQLASASNARRPVGLSTGPRVSPMRAPLPCVGDRDLSLQLERRPQQERQGLSWAFSHEPSQDATGPWGVSLGVPLGVPLGVLSGALSRLGHMKG